jgi:hypothetical protein
MNESRMFKLGLLSASTKELTLHSGGRKVMVIGVHTVRLDSCRGRLNKNQ